MGIAARRPSRDRRERRAGSVSGFAGFWIGLGLFCLALGIESAGKYIARALSGDSVRRYE